MSLSSMPRQKHCSAFFGKNRFATLPVLFCLLIASRGLALAAPVATSTTLTVIAGGVPVATVSAKTPVTLTAKVTTATAASAVPGQVLFCDDAIANCALSPVGLAQTVTGVGSATATYTFLPGPSTHSYSARFLANTSYAGSTSASQSLNVTSAVATTTALTSSLANSRYTLNAQVTAQKAVNLAAGVTFTDTTSGVTLGSGSAGVTLASTALTNTAQPFTGDNGACAVVTGDFNGDGIPDIAVGVGCRAPNGSNSANALEILLGKGDGTFATAAASTGFSNTNVLTLATGDFNNDGIPDLVASTATSTSAPGSNLNYTYGLSFVAGKGDGTFAAPVSLRFTCNNSHIVTGDFNNDGNLDFAADCYNSSSASTAVQVFLGIGNGRFSGTGLDVAAGTARFASALVSGDVNNDGLPDLIVGGYSGSYTVTVLLGKGDSTFTIASSYPILNGFATALGDVNGDGKADLVSLASVAGTPASTLLSTQLGNGDGTFATAVTTPVQVSAGSLGSTLLTADFDGDHRSDAAIVTYNTVRLLHGTTTGAFSGLASFPLPATSAPDNFPAALADLDGDGVTDLFASSSDGTTALALLTTATSTGTVQITTASPIGNGNHAVTASYAGDNYTAASTSAPVTLAAAPAPTTLTLAAAPAQTSLGAQVLLTASLSPYSAGTLTTDGESIIFTSGGRTLGSANLRAGVASINLTSLPLGANSIFATYMGDANFVASTSSSAVETVVAPSAPAVSSTALTFAAQAVSTASTAQTVTLTNTAAGPLTITSIVAAGDFSQSNGCGNSLAAGASCTIAVRFTPSATGARTGTLTITDNSVTATQNVALTGTGAVPFIATSDPSSLTVTRGGSSQSSIQIKAATGYAGTVALSCAVSFQGTGASISAPTCTLSPTSVTVTSGGTATSTLNVFTTAASASLSPMERGSGIALAGLCMMACLARRRHVRGALLAVLCTLLLGFASGCGGGSSTSLTGPTGTTPGSYTVTVSAAAGASTTTAVVPLVVQ